MQFAADLAVNGAEGRVLDFADVRPARRRGAFDVGYRIHPCSNAMRTACVRLATPSFR